MVVSEPEENYITGWIKIYRSISNKGWYRNSKYVHLWVHLIISATHKEREYFWNGNMLKLGAGQFVTGRKRLSEETGISETTIERILKVFESEQQIGQQKSNTSRLISITNYNIYQTDGQQNGQRTDNGRTTDGQRTDTKQEFKNDKNDKNDKNTIPPESEFLEYCKTFLNDKYKSYEFSLKAKYDSWKENGWRDGYNKPIKIWKTKIRNVLPTLRPNKDLMIQTSNIPTIGADGKYQR